MRNHYFKTKVTKMGKWNTPPLDIGTWYSQETNKFFKKTFGLPKGLLTLYVSADGYMHAYVPTSYFTWLHRRIGEINRDDYQSLERKLKTFYPLDKKARTAVKKVYKNAKALSNHQLAQAFIAIRHWVHQVVVFDQFGWLGEEYWTPLMRHVLEKRLGLKHGSPEYNNVLFALTKPEHISTTLAEKQAVLAQAIKIKQHRTTFIKSAKLLAQKFGWMPIFTYGNPWLPAHYTQELSVMTKKKLTELERDHEQLKNYRQIRDRDIAEITKKYGMHKKDLQIFIEFGLALDTRNEAEYFVSYAGKFLMPIYAEAQKRLHLSPKQLRELTEQDLVDTLRGKRSIEKVLAAQGKYGGWGYDGKMKSVLKLSPMEAEKLFNYIESYVKPIQGGDESRGTCASPGKARGKIRIVPYPDQNHKVKDGDILVTYATTVDYLPAMKRAAAIITEVGGLTCHAAVVSREFGIPCIVALSNAMTNFKDGDMVEVDADKGVVRRLK